MKVWVLGLILCGTPKDFGGNQRHTHGMKDRNEEEVIGEVRLVFCLFVYLFICASLIRNFRSVDPASDDRLGPCLADLPT